MIIIPAKYGSSRAPLKNFRVFYNNLSLLQIAIIRCVTADRGPVIVSSENTEAVLRQVSQLPSPYWGKVIVHERPEKLARDPATILDVMADYLQSLRGDLPEAVSVVLPTSPFNGIASITSAWEQFLSSESPKLLSVSEMTKPPFNAWVKKQGGKSGEIEHAFPDSAYRLTQSTACPQTFLSNGCISIYDVSKLMGSRDFHKTIGFEMPRIDIDFEFEFELAKFSFARWADDLECFQA